MRLPYHRRAFTGRVEMMPGNDDSKLSSTGLIPRSCCGRAGVHRAALSPVMSAPPLFFVKRRRTVAGQISYSNWRDRRDPCAPSPPAKDSV
jgi:hypothetical protein